MCWLGLKKSNSSRAARLSLGTREEKMSGIGMTSTRTRTRMVERMRAESHVGRAHGSEGHDVTKADVSVRS